MLTLVLGAAAVAGCSAHAEPAAPTADTVVIWHGTVFDGTGRDPVRDGAVVIQGGTIVAVGRLDAIPRPDRATWIDAGGGTILPGVIDAHAHVMANLLAGSDILSPWLLSGVTTLQDMGIVDGEVDQMRQLLASVPVSPPRVDLAGPLITAPGGYPTGRPYAAIAHPVASVEEARADVAELIDSEDVALVKIAIERGFDADYGDPGWPALTPAEIEAITETAHARGVPVAAHLTGPAEMEVAIQAGVDIVAHVPIMPASDALLHDAAERGIIVDSTIGAWSTEDVRYSVQAAANAARFHELGGRLAIGTDYPFAPASMPLTEFDLLAKAGIPARDLVVAATRDAAAAIGRESDLGTLEPGKRADVIVVQGDPLSDWRAMARVSVVVLGGRVVLDELGRAAVDQGGVPEKRASREIARPEDALAQDPPAGTRAPRRTLRRRRGPTPGLRERGARRTSIGRHPIVVVSGRVLRSPGTGRRCAIGCYSCSSSWRCWQAAAATTRPRPQQEVEAPW